MTIAPLRHQAPLPLAGDMGDVGVVYRSVPVYFRPGLGRTPLYFRGMDPHLGQYSNGWGDGGGFDFGGPDGGFTDYGGFDSSGDGGFAIDVTAPGPDFQSTTDIPSPDTLMTPDFGTSGDTSFGATDPLQILMDQGSLTQSDVDALNAGISQADIWEARNAGANDDDIAAMATGQVGFDELMQTLQPGWSSGMMDQAQAGAAQPKPAGGAAAPSAGGGSAGGKSASPPSKPQGPALPPGCYPTATGTVCPKAGVSPAGGAGGAQPISWWDQQMIKGLPNKFLVIGAGAALFLFGGGTQYEAQAPIRRRRVRTA